jgi:hypothetical protein
MKFVETQNMSETIQVTFELTREELKLITDGLGSTSQQSRENIGMSKTQASKVWSFYYCLSSACEKFNITLDYE